MFGFRCDVFSFYSGFSCSLFRYWRWNATFVQHFQVFGYTNVASSTCSRRLVKKWGSYWIFVNVNRVVESALLNDNHSLLVTWETLRAVLRLKWLVSFKWLETSRADSQELHWASTLRWWRWCDLSGRLSVWRRRLQSAALKLLLLENKHKEISRSFHSDLMHRVVSRPSVFSVYL